MSVQGWETSLHPVFVWEVGSLPITPGLIMVHSKPFTKLRVFIKMALGGSLISGLHLGFLHEFLAVMVKLQACHVWATSSLSPHVVAAKCEAR